MTTLYEANIFIQDSGFMYSFFIYHFFVICTRVERIPFHMEFRQLKIWGKKHLRVVDYAILILWAQMNEKIETPCWSSRVAIRNRTEQNIPPLNIETPNLKGEMYLLDILAAEDTKTATCLSEFRFFSSVTFTRLEHSLFPNISPVLIPAGYLIALIVYCDKISNCSYNGKA